MVFSVDGSYKSNLCGTNTDTCTISEAVVCWSLNQGNHLGIHTQKSIPGPVRTVKSVYRDYFSKGSPVFNSNLSGILGTKLQFKLTCIKGHLS